MKTLAIIKPDAVENGSVGYCLWMAELHNLRIAQLRWIHLTDVQARFFYLEHQGKPFYEKLVRFMSSGPCVVAELNGGDEAVASWRFAMRKIRAVEADEHYSERNAVHGSDSDESAQREVEFFFG